MELLVQCFLDVIFHLGLCAFGKVATKSDKYDYIHTSGSFSTIVYIKTLIKNTKMTIRHDLVLYFVLSFFSANTVALKWLMLQCGSTSKSSSIRKDTGEGHFL